jgi:hypothetical protein
VAPADKANARGLIENSIAPSGEVLVLNPRLLVGEYCPFVNP